MMSFRAMTFRAVSTVVLGLIVTTILSSCAAGDDDRGTALRIVTTTGMIEDAARNVGGDLVDVEALMGPGVDPHLYKATQGDLARLTKADVVLYNGLHLEGKM